MAAPSEQAGYPFVILRAVDIHPQPGPAKFPCTVCTKAVSNHHKALECDLCNKWGHIKCIDISTTEYKRLCELENFKYTCHLCNQTLKELPYADVSCISSNDSIITHNTSLNTSSSTSPG